MQMILCFVLSEPAHIILWTSKQWDCHSPRTQQCPWASTMHYGHG